MARTRDDNLDTFDLLEEAAHLLRRSPAVVIAAYLAGTVPFLLAALYFVADMSSGAHAYRHLPEAALAMAALFLWMKTWQAHAAEHALALLEGRPATRVGVRGLFSSAMRQARIHGFGLFALPCALVVTIPFAWLFAYYQSATVLDRTASAGLHQESARQCRLWPRQNHLVLSILLLLGFVVFLNVAVAIYLGPRLLRTFFGLENYFATVGWNPFNTTFLAAAVAVSFLCVDPFVKAVYVVRCYHGKALRTGLDLLLQARLRPRAASLALVVLAAVAFVPAAPPLLAAETPSASDATAAVEAEELAAAVDRVLEKPDYAWRMPRESLPESDGEKGLIGRFFDSVFGLAQRTIQWVGDVVEKLFDWLLDSRRDSSPVRASSASFAGLSTVVRFLMIALACVLVLALAWFVFRWWSQSRLPAASVVEPIATPELEREDVSPEELPEDEWMRLGRELLAKGEVRLALRAFFLGSLVALARHQMLILARHKSNRDYERELLGHGGSDQAMRTAFMENRRLLEQAWYGGLAAGPGEIERYANNVRLLTGMGEPAK